MTDEVVAEPLEVWLFPFGPRDVHPETGASLEDRYVRLVGGYAETREKMMSLFGSQWSHQVPGDREVEFIVAYQGTLLPEEEWPKPVSGEARRRRVLETVVMQTHDTMLAAGVLCVFVEGRYERLGELPMERLLDICGALGWVEEP